MSDKVRDFHWRKPDRVKQPPVPTTEPVGPLLRWLSVTHYARFGSWPESLTMYLCGAPVPPDLEREAKAEQLLEQARIAEALRHAR
jgi:hypothetical protein